MASVHLGHTGLTVSRLGFGTADFGARSLHIPPDYVDLFLLHSVTADWIENSREVLRALRELKAAGVLRALGLSTQSVTVAREASRFDEVDVIMVVCCPAPQAAVRRYQAYVPLEDGSMAAMHRSIRLAHRRGKGVVAIKVLGGNAPPLARQYQRLIRSAAWLNYVNALLVRMRSLAQVRRNIAAILAG
jgi:aryl-alcohol dehydrogenase-like predicted oxidoreductase